MKRLVLLFTPVLAVATFAAPALAKRCPADSVKAGTICIDKYEASVWSTTDTTTIKRIQKGQIASAADLSAAVRHGAAGDDYGTGCPDDASGCTSYYAVSIPGVLPSVRLTWFQAQAACRNAGKRLATSAEWQAAAYGTPDPGTDNGSSDCNISNTMAPANTGSRSSCKSDVGAFDMVGNVWEWVADWNDYALNGCTTWTNETAIGGNDLSCFGGDGSGSSKQVPAGTIRGGSWNLGAAAGVFAVDVEDYPSDTGDTLGFRCAR